MGWLLSIWLSLPVAGGDLEIDMWFSRESYCNFALEKFLENPMRLTASDGDQFFADISNAACRKLGKDEMALVPEHMRK